MNALLRATAFGSAILLSGLLTGCAPPEDVNSEEYAGSIDDPTNLHGKPEPPMLGVHSAKGAGRPGGGGGSDPKLAYGGGNVMGSVEITPIYWGTTVSKDTAKQTGLDGFYAAYVGSKYAATNTEYTGNGGPVTATNIIVNAPVLDATASMTHAPKTSDILNEVCKRITNPKTNGYYPVYTDTKRGSAGYCAWHSWGTCGTTQVQFGFFFNLDGDAGCDPQDTESGHTQGLAALANVTGHELSETVTDPRGNGWVDAQGGENADKCAWTYPTNGTDGKGNPGTLVQLSDGSYWKVQGNWSNAAYTAATGYATKANPTLPGCINGF